MNDKEFDNLLAGIFNSFADIKIYLRQLKETMDVEDEVKFNKAYYHIDDFLYDLDTIDRLILDYSLTKMKGCEDE